MMRPVVASRQQQQIQRLANHPGAWISAWEPAPVLHVAHAGARGTSALAARPAPPFTARPIREALVLHPSHALVRSVPDWGFRITEPQATKGLAHMVDGNMARMRALLFGLGIHASEDEIGSATIEAETADRIDLLIRLGPRAVIVEAKFGHRVMAGQLSTYWKKTAPRAKTQGVLLLIDPDTAPALHPKQRSHWHVRSWAIVALTLERAMAVSPDDDDDDFRLFRRLLWHRVGGLSMRTHT